jgi:hypothetical protein
MLLEYLLLASRGKSDSLWRRTDMERRMIARLRRAAKLGGFLGRRLLVDSLADPARASAFRLQLERQRDAERRQARIPLRRLADLWPAPGPVTVEADALREGNPTLVELFCLGVIARGSCARAMFEIGTFDGSTTLQLALNSPPDATIYTLDLPSDEVDRTRAALLPGERSYVLKPGSGSRFLGSPAQGKIRQLFGDSAAFSAGTLAGRMDLVVVDGSHALDYVRSDSALARTLTRPGGWIVWHDYGVWPDVTAGLLELAGALPLVQLEATTLVVAQVPRRAGTLPGPPPPAGG